MWLPRGIILNRDLSKIHPVDHEKVTEYVTRSWYTYSGGDDKGKHPWDGETDFKYTRPQPPYKELNTDAKYTWLKAPRYDKMAMEVGPLSRMLLRLTTFPAPCWQLDCVAIIPGVPPKTKACRG